MDTKLQLGVRSCGVLLHSRSTVSNKKLEERIWEVLTIKK
jgi:hypothetical protein